MGTAIKHPVPDRVKPSFVIFDIWTLWRSALSDCTVPRTRTKFGDRAFSVAGPVVWNSLPAAVREADSLHSFRRKLKTHLFTLCLSDRLAVSCKLL